MSRRKRKRRDAKRKPAEQDAARADGSERLFHWGTVILLLILAVLVFGQSVGFDFVDYDDDIYIGNRAASRVIQDGLSWEGLGWIWTANVASLWEPLNYLSHMIDVQLFGAEPDAAGKHHLTNLVLHCLNGLLAYYFFLLLTRMRWCAAIAAGLFLIHPMRAETVGWISERKGLLCAAFVLSALIAYVLAARRNDRRLLVACFVLAGLGMMSKPAAVVVPALAMLLDYWPLSRCGFDTNRVDWTRLAVLQVREKAVLFLMSAGLALVSIRIQYGTNQGKLVGAMPLLERLAWAPANLLFYFQRTLLPQRLTFEYPYPDRNMLLAGAAFFVVTTSVLWFQRERLKPLWFGWLWFLICWLPVSGIAYVGLSFTTDRYTYLPHIGLMLGVAVQIASWCGDNRNLSRIAIGGGTLCILLLIPITRMQCATWRNNDTLNLHAIKTRPTVATGYANLAVTLERKGMTAQAIPLLERAIQLRHDYTALYNLARLYSRNPDQVEEAKQMYRQSIDLNPQYHQAWHNLGVLHMRQGSLDEALANVSKACDIEAPNSLYLNSLAEIHSLRREFRKALEAVELALEQPIDQPALSEVLLKRRTALNQVLRRAAAN